MKSNPLKQAVARACTDADYRRRLLADPHPALAELGIDVPVGVEIHVHEPTDDKMLLVLPAAHGFDLRDAVPEMPAGPVADVPPALSLHWRATTLFASGRIDSTTAPALRRELERAFVDVELEMAAVDYMSSAGIGALIAAQKVLEDREGSLTLCNVPESIRNVFELGQMAGLFEFQDGCGTTAPLEGRFDAFGTPKRTGNRPDDA